MEGGLDFAWAGKSLVYGLGQLAIGTLVFRQLLRQDDVYAWLSRLAFGVSCLLVAALLLRAWAQTATAFGVEEAWLPENLRLIAFESRWGAGWRLQMLAALAMLGTTLVMTGQRTAAWTAFALSTVGLAVAMPLLDMQPAARSGKSCTSCTTLVRGCGSARWA